MSKGEPIKPSTTHFFFCAQSCNSSKIWLSQLMHGNGEEYGKKFKLGRGPIFGKHVLTSLARKMPKNVCHSAIHPRSSFCSHRESLGAVFDLHDLGCCMFSSRFWALDIFPHHQKSKLGSLSQSDGSLLCVNFDFGFAMYFFLTWTVVLHFLESENFVFVMFLWLGSSPTISVAFPQCLPS